MFDPTQPAQQTRPAKTSVAQPNKKCWTAHNWAEAPYCFDSLTVLLISPARPTRYGKRTYKTK